MVDFTVTNAGIHPLSPPVAPSHVPFPQIEEEFRDDDRVSYDKEYQKYVLEENNKEFEWNATYKKWIETTDEALLEQQRSAYKMAGVDEDTPATGGTKRKVNSETETQVKKAKKEPVQRVNTSVYVTGIPTHAEFDEIRDLFKKYGILARQVDSNTDKIVMYTDNEGDFKGDCLITYYRPESVAQAISLLDETDFYTGTAGPMRVQPADMSYKKQNNAPAAGNVPPKSSKAGLDRQKIKAITKDLEYKRSNWSDDEEEEAPAIPKITKWDYYVVLKRMFTFEELAEYPEAIEDIKQDIKDAAEKHGKVTNLVLYDREEDGVVMVRFEDHENAKKFAMAFAGQVFSGRNIEIYIPTSNERFRKTAPLTDPAEEEAAEAARLEAYGQSLEEAALAAELIGLDETAEKPV